MSKEYVKELEGVATEYLEHLRLLRTKLLAKKRSKNDIIFTMNVMPQITIIETKSRNIESVFEREGTSRG